MEKIQVIQPTKLLAPYIKQYWFLRIDDVKQGFQRSIPAGCVALVFHKGNKIISSFHKGTQPQSYISMGHRTKRILRIERKEYQTY